jgi:hypothetical protein
MFCDCAHHGAVEPARPVPRFAVTAALVLQPLDVSPDGEARLLVRVQYHDAAGERVHLPPGGHVDVFASRGTVQWQPRARLGDPAAIVRLTEAGPLALRVTSDLPRVPRVLTAQTDTRAWRLSPVTAKALGPHVVVIGWFPRVRSGRVRIARVSAEGTRVVLPAPVAPASSLRDTTVTPGAQYTYEISRQQRDRIDVGVGVPAELPPSTIDMVRGKAMWLSFDDVSHWNVGAMLDRAQVAGLRAIQLRLCYGEYAYFTPARRAIIDRFIDGAAARHITVIAWTVPRAVTFEDLAANVASAAYRTPAGNGVRGVAVDLERGADFLGTGAVGYAALATYLARLREAVGPRVLLVATVEDPNIERLTEADVPYAAIAASADVLQPMVYWRARQAGASIAGMRSELRASYALIGQRASRPIPIDIGGQTAGLGNRFDAPPADEVAASFRQASALGAIGETLFDWGGTSSAQWTAIAQTAWPSISTRP